MHPFEVIQRPVISEKAAALAEVAGRYVFMVHPQANKFHIKAAVEALFQVKVSRVRTMVTHGKTKRVGRGEVKLSGKKKAIVVLKPGQKIDLTQAR